ncbi:MAG: competence protein TfoX [Sideroxydans sp.]|nr:competence protein TfoX [Sideroxydans sp.]
MNLADLPNFGPKSQQMLERGGIKTVDQLRKLGAVCAYVQVKSVGKVSLNLLWAMEGALTDMHWRVVAKQERLRLLLELEDVKKGHVANEK